MAASAGPHGGLPASLPSTYETSTTTPLGSAQPGFRLDDGNGFSPMGDDPVSIIVEGADQLGERMTLLRPKATDNLIHRCLTDRLGSILDEPSGAGLMVNPGGDFSHQRPGDRSGDSGYSPLEYPASRPQGNSLVEQHYHSGLHKPTGRNKVTTTPDQDMGVVDPLRGPEHHHQCLSPGGQGEYISRCPIEGNLPEHRVVPSPVMDGSGVRVVRTTASGSLRIRREFSPPNVLFETIQPTSMEDSCVLLSLDGAMSILYTPSRLGASYAGY